MNRIAALLLGAGLAASAHATVLTWTGAFDGDFFAASNWGSQAPIAGDSVVFSGPSPQTSVNLSGSLKVTNITFDGTSRPNYTFNGTNSAELEIEGTVTLSGSGDVTAGSGLALKLSNNSGNTFSVDTGAKLTIAGPIRGAVGIIKTGDGTLVLTGTNSYVDKTVIAAGTLSVSTLGTVSGPSSLGNDNTVADYLFVRIGQLTSTGTLQYTGGTNVSTNRGIDMAGTTGGATLDSSGTGAVTYSSFRVSGTGQKTLTLTGTSNGTNTINAIIPDSGGGATSLVKSNTGTWKLDAANTYSGGTTLSGGKLIVNNNSSLGTGGVTLSGGTLSVDGGTTIGNTLSFTSSGNASVLTGTGTFSSQVSATTNSVIAPGNPVGTLNFSNGLTIGTGSAISFQIQNAAGSAGSGYDLINVSGGSLSLTASTNTITFNVVTLDGNGAYGQMANFDPAQSYSWTFATLSAGNTAGNITGFSSSQFNLVSSEFANATNGGSFSFSDTRDPMDSGRIVSLQLNFTPVPEPSTYLLMGSGLSLMAAAAWRRRRS